MANCLWPMDLGNHEIHDKPPKAVLMADGQWLMD